MMEHLHLKPPVWQVRNGKKWQIHLKGVQVAEGGLSIESLPPDVDARCQLSSFYAVFIEWEKETLELPKWGRWKQASLTLK